MADDTTDEDNEWLPRFRVDEELEFFTDLAFHETERWMQAVTKKKLSHPDDLRCALQNGVMLCELVNGLQPGSIPRINRHNTPIAGLDNLTLFLKACQQKFGLRQPQLFDPLDLEDLSQRAAFSDENPAFLKQETDRRLRNVALTVYWLGQVARELYSGPQLDQSAFSGLVTQNPGVLSPEQSPQRKSLHSPYSESSYTVTNSRNNFRGSNYLSNSRQSNNSVLNSSDYSNNSDQCLSTQSNTSDLIVSQRSSTISPHEGGHVASEASYDSNDLGSDGGLSIDPADMSRHGSTSNLSRWGHGDSPVYSSHDINNPMYRSSPNLAQGSHAHNLSSSTDSLDGGHGFHSRQSSGSMENYSTRRLSSTGRPSRPSVTSNPLQFIKAKGSSQLAQTAQKQIQIAEESKKIKWDTLMETTEDNDWQSKLGNWKSKRRTKSSTSYDQKEEEKEAIEKENEEKAQRSTKTFKEMVQERDRRKSMNSYPLEDENDEYTANNRSSDINHNRTESARSMQSSGSLDDSLAFDSSAPWAASSDDDTFKRDNRVGNGLPSESDTESNKENWTEQEESQINNNNTKYNKSSVSPKLSKEKNNEEQTMSNQKPKSNKLSNLLQAFEEQAESDIEYKAVSRRSAQKSTAITDQSSVSEEPKISPRSPRTDKDSVEKSITISQKPNSEKGFGFTFTGGRDLSQPIVVEKVSLGGAADVCEVRVKDEILEINRRKAATYSHTQVEDLIKRAVRTGKLELKVKRFIRKGSYLSDEFSEEDSFDRFEEQMEKEQEMKSNSRNERSGLTPMMDSLLREKHDHSADNGIGKWEEPMQEDELTDRQTGQGYEDMSYSPQPVEEEELHISNKRPVRNAYSAFVEPESNQSQVEEETEEEIEEDEAPSPEREPSPVQQSRNVLSSYKHSYTPYSPDSDYKPASVITAESGKPINFDVSLPVNQSSTPENNGFGPPTALLRWQRRPRSQYEKEQDEKTDHSANQTQFLVDINQSNSSTSKRMEDEQEIKPTVVPRGKLDLSREIKKMEDWDRKQEQKRQPDVTMPTEQNQEQREFEQNVEAINSRWESDQEKALTMEQEKRQKDEFILSEERKRVAEMEQRKAERRAQRHAQLAEPSSQQVSRPSTLQQQVTRPQIEVTKGRPQPLESSELVLQIPGQGEYGGLQIDPLNRPDLTPRTLDGYSAVNFMLNLNQKPTGSSLASTNNAEVMRERERLQQEEVAMRRRIEEEKAADDRRLREREEQIKRQEERLRQEEERLRFEQERLQRERQQHLQTFNLTSQHGETPASLPKLSPSYPSSSPSSLSPPFNSQPEADQQFSSTVVIAKASPNNYYVKSVQQAPYQSPFSSSALNKREDKASERLTREDLMAMSRSARPLEEKPPSLQQEEQPVLQTTVVPVKTAVSQPTPMVREAPSKQEKHSLNAVPRSRLQDSKGWIEQRQEDRASPKQAAPRPARRSDIMKKQYTSSQDHWLVQEAERRRLEEQNYNGQRPSSRQYITGPIKPHESLTTNRWRETGPQYHPSKAKNNLRSSTSFEQMRQKFSEQPKDPQPLRATNAALQPRAAPRQIPSGPVSAREDSLGWQTKNSANPAYMGRNGSREGEMVRSSPKPAPRSRSTPAAPGNSPEPTMAVSGRQRCSHCEEELGYGAAMVIESLNLHYHMQCFRCCVCRTQLGNGAEGADVRVRGWKLHCRNCYSNDEAGLKFSKV